MNKLYWTLMIACASILNVQAQNTSTPVLVDSNSKLIEFLSAASYNVKKVDSTNYVILVGNVQIRQGKTLMYGDSIVLNTTSNILEGFGHIHINDADSVHTYAEYLRYLGNNKKAFLRKKVKLTDGRGVLTTDSLDYDVSIKVGQYNKGGKLVRNKTVLKSVEGFYYGITRDVYIFTADEMAIDDSLGLGEFRGNALYKSKDSLSFDMIANHIKTNRSKGVLLATELPTLLIKQKKDTLFISADTLFSAKISDLKRPMPQVRDVPVVNTDSSLDKYFEAFHNVKIYSDSLQAKCDSLFYGLADSTIRLITQPIVWSNENQITGDTIYMFVNNKQPEQLNVINNAFAINKVDTTQYFNQIKGTRLKVWFEDGSISKMQTKGGAENLYFVLDDEKKFIGVNHSTAQIMEIEFENSEPAKVKFVNQLQGKMNPLNKTVPEDLILRGFKWQESIRPKSKFEILSPSSSKPL